MNNSMKFLGMLFLVSALVLSCSEDNDPSDDNLFVGTYRGSASYSSSDDNMDISTDRGRVTVVKVGDNYRFDFSNSIPSINGLEVEKNQSVLINSSATVEIDE